MTSASTAKDSHECNRHDAERPPFFVWQNDDLILLSEHFTGEEERERTESMEDETVGSGSFSVTDLSVALVREFLHRGGHADALRAFDASLTSSSSREGGDASGSNAPTSRSALRRALSLEKQAARAKARSENGSTPTSLEVLVGTHMQRIEQKHQHQAPMTMKTTTINVSSSSSFTRTHAGGDMSMSDLHAAIPPVRASAEFEALKTSTSLDATHSSSSSSSSRRLQRPQTAHSLGRSRSADVVVVEDFDEDFEMGPVSAPQIDVLANRRVQTGEPVHHEMWRQAVRLLSRSSAGLGGGAGMESAAACVPDSWLQGFYFRPSPKHTKGAAAHEMSASSSSMTQNSTKLPYGLVQAEGGPCGVLAAVQAQMIKEHLSRGARVTCLGGITSEDAKALLVHAIAAIIWRAGSAAGGGGSSAGLALPAGSGAVMWHQATSLEDMESLVRDALGNLGNRLGIVIVVMSLVLARGPKAVAKDMDDTGLTGSTADASLVGAHGYCTQELVNLLLCGRAVSNVFDGVKVLENDSVTNEKITSSTELRGITSRADIGFLTLFEWYKYMEVGSYYKFPKFPVWVVCSESHFSTLFLHVDADADADATNQYATSTLDASSPPLRLAYYDGLASQEDEIVLTLRYDANEGGHTGRREHAGHLNSSGSAADATAPAVPVPPLEYVIETRWPRVAVDWNDSEKIL